MFRRYAPFLLITLPSVVVALFFLNRPRFWWQESVCNLALYLLAPCVALAVWCVRGLFRCRLRSFPLLLAVVAQLYVIGFIGSLAWPYLRYDRWPTYTAEDSASLRILFVTNWRSEDESRDFAGLVARYSPDLVVISGRERDFFDTFLPSTRLAHRFRFGEPGDGSIEIASALPLRNSEALALGLNAFPGGVVPVEVAPDVVLKLGVLALEPSFSKAQFERNRVTARRLSSIMRGGQGTRVVLANFNATPFSQLAYVYRKQARLRSAFYGMGLLASWDMRSWWARFSASDVLISKDARPIRRERVELPSRSHAAWFVELEIPRAR